MASIYEHVTAEVIKALETGVAPWIKPWANDGKAVSPWGLPYNAGRGSEYRGANVLILWSAAKRAGYESHAWLTLRQCNELGGKVIKGERATWVHFYLWREDPKNPAKRFPTLKAYRVFNVAQCEGLPERIAVRTDYQELSQGAIEERVRSLGVKVRMGGNRAYYQPGEDRIAIPLPGQFKTPENFYATLMHECTHATGAKHRLDRNLTGHFGDQSYAAEELIAEMGAAFCMARFGRSLEGLQHPEYLASWLKVLRSDSRAILRAASAAQKACDLIMGDQDGDDDGEEIVAPVEVPVSDAVYPVPMAAVPVVADSDTKALAADYIMRAVSTLYWIGHSRALDRETAAKVEAIKARTAKPKARVRKPKPEGLPAGWHRHPVTGWPVRYNGKDIRDAIPYGHDPEKLAIVAKHYRTHARIGAANVLTMLETTGQDATNYRHGLMSRRREQGPHRYNYGAGRIDPSHVLESNQSPTRNRFRDETATGATA